MDGSMFRDLDKLFWALGIILLLVMGICTVSAFNVGKRVGQSEVTEDPQHQCLHTEELQ